MQNFPVTRDLVLIGGGHAHALVLRMWGMKPLAGVRVTVINPGPTAPYSGMLPGHIAGHYTQPDLEIDLVQLAQFAGARIIVGSAVGIDPKTRRITVPGRPEVAYDVASIDVGITAQMPMIKGFLEHAIGAKPLDVYAKAWRDFLADVTAGRKDPRVAVIGGGVAGVELSLAMSHALRTAGHLGRVTIVEAGADISGVSAATRALLHREMIAQGVDLKSNLTVREITKGACHLSDGSVLAADMIVGAAGAIPHYWVSRIAVPQTSGYINVEETLLVQGFSDLFAVGDCAHMMAHPRPKAGVFAVRAAPVLYENLKAALSTGPLTPFVPQRRYLKLISLGGQRAAAEKWERVVHGRALWRWKNAIDQKFMNQFRGLSPMAAPERPTHMAAGLAEMLDDKPLCGGCGAKVGTDVLTQSLCDMPNLRDDILTGVGDDAAVIRTGGATQVLTTDHLRAFTQDPVLMTKISALHAMGDVWAMGAKPQVVLTNLILPRQSEALQQRMLDEIMLTARAVFEPLGAQIVGGHTSMGSELTIGFTITGLLEGDAITTSGAKPGDKIIVTRPIGSGIILAAQMLGAARGADVVAVLNEMSTSQEVAAQLLRAAHAMTDVTGFGLVGHLGQICKNSGVSARLNLENIPVYQGAMELSAAGHRSSIMPSNRAHARVKGLTGDPKEELLFDPQTAGGLLACIPSDRAEDILRDLLAHGYIAAIIGEIDGGLPEVTIES